MIVGHIMFSPVVLPARPELKLMGLAPMAVVRERQRKGIGCALVRVGLEQCKHLGVGAVVVLGHSEYYPRFGFSPSVALASAANTKCRKKRSWSSSSGKDFCRTHPGRSDTMPLSASFSTTP
jgi:predicted N-acetyltransferase YhbS